MGTNILPPDRLLAAANSNTLTTSNVSHTPPPVM